MELTTKERVAEGLEEDWGSSLVHSQLSYTAQGHLPRYCAAHSGLSHPVPINSQLHPTAMPTDEPNVQLLLSLQRILGCVKLTAPAE